MEGPFGDADAEAIDAKPDSEVTADAMGMEIEDDAEGAATADGRIIVDDDDAVNNIAYSIQPTGQPDHVPDITNNRRKRKCAHPVEH